MPVGACSFLFKNIFLLANTVNYTKNAWIVNNNNMKHQVDCIIKTNYFVIFIFFFLSFFFLGGGGE